MGRIDFDEGWWGGETVFAPATGATQEDMGYLINMLRTDTGDSALFIWSAKSMANEPVAKIHLPDNTPYGFHTTWIPQKFPGSV